MKNKFKWNFDIFKGLLILTEICQICLEFQKTQLFKTVYYLNCYDKAINQSITCGVRQEEKTHKMFEINYHLITKPEIAFSDHYVRNFICGIKQSCHATR